MLSHVHGATAPALIDSTIGDYFDAIAERFADREALVVPHQQVRWNYAAFKQRVDCFAMGLLGLGLQPGDRLAIWAPNCAEWVIAQFATAKTGIILVTLNPAYRRAELEYALELAGCRALIAAPNFKRSDNLAIVREIVPEIDAAMPGALAAARLPSLQTIIRLGRDRSPGMVNFDDLIVSPEEGDAEVLAAIAAQLVPTDVVNIQFTSGTTGMPKGAALTHRNILNNAFFVGEGMRLGERDHICVPVPLFHTFGMVIANLAGVTHGAALVLPGESFNPAATLRTVAAERCTVAHGVPTMFIAMLEQPDFATHDLSSLRTGMMAGAPCPIDVMRRVIDLMHMRDITIGYGMTETSPISCQCAIDDPLELRVGTVGRVQPHLEIKIVDADGATVSRGTAGELMTRGYSVMRGYWNDPERTAEAIDPEGWMRTGDLATIDDAGYCRIVGRAKDLVIRGGENISPREIEEFLFGHPAVQDVQVVGAPDARFGEEVCAFIILRPGVALTAEDLRAFCRGQIAQYKVPRYVRFVEAFPLTVSGKVQKNVLRQQIAHELAGPAERKAA